MSGICAVWRRGPSERMIEGLTAVTAGLSQDAVARTRYETDQSVGLGVCARFETQQVYRSEQALVACDADLYNEDELRAWAGRPAPEARNATASLIAALYERFGRAFVERLRGAFSIILWDVRKKELLAAIDGFGIRRLVYYQDRNVLIVASRIGAVLQCPGVEARINQRSVANVLNFTTNLAPDTIFTEVARLRPGTLLAASENDTRTSSYWDMRYGLPGDRDAGRLARKLESLVETSVAAHCKSDPFDGLGAFLSGGTDSSTVVGMMARMGRGPVKAFSIGFEEQVFNELGYARIAAAKFGALHHTYLVGPNDCFDALPRIVGCFDEPFANSSAIPTYFCARLAADHGVKALLAGDGGDELFGGNERYRTDKIFGLYQILPRPLRTGLVEPLLTLLPMENGVVGKARRYASRSNLPPLERFFSYHFLCSHALTDVFEEEFLKTLEDYNVLAVPSDYYHSAPARDHLDRLLYVDMKITLADSDLPKVTCVSELAGIQVRFPFLDRQVAEFSGIVPAGLKVRRLEKRYLFKLAFRNLLPVEILRKKKHGFGIPVATWLKTDRRFRELSHDLVLSNRALQRGYFRRRFLEDLFRKHEADESTYYGDTLWSVLMLELWHRQTLDERVKVVA